MFLYHEENVIQHSCTGNRRNR